ncbi:inositol-1-monophosphatase [Klebsiella pneumoniae]|uniref:Inositol-1-monophosphatase n=1 Tax=Klebsiella pneumoniae TaxID=573 RepID=A0A377U2A1_KLEPN|nr:inositol-1-monophosphatase [Klebsiella pneumoniae]
MNTLAKSRMFNGLSIHWMAPPTSLNVCRTSLFPSPYASKGVLKSRWSTIRCVTNCLPRPAAQGAQLNGYRLRGSNARDLDGTIIATGFPFKAKQHATTYMNILGNMFTECADFRRTGSAALDLAYVAAGRVDGYFEIALKPWDFAAGELIAREAGAIVCDFTGGHNYMLTGNIVAGNPRVVKAMLANMREQLSDALKR